VLVLILVGVVVVVMVAKLFMIRRIHLSSAVAFFDVGVTSGRGGRGHNHARSWIVLFDSEDGISWFMAQWG
jgi:hypothetical protein